MYKIEIKITGRGKARRLATFLELVNFYDKPNIKKTLIVEEDRQLAFLFSPEINLEIIAE